MELEVAERAVEEDGGQKVSIQADRLLALGAVGAILSVSRREVYRLISRGALPQPVKIGRSSKLPESEVAAYIEKLKGARAPVSAAK